MLDHNIDPNYVCKLNKLLHGLKQSIPQLVEPYNTMGR